MIERISPSDAFTPFAARAARIRRNPFGQQRTARLPRREVFASSEPGVENGTAHFQQPCHLRDLVVGLLREHELILTVAQSICAADTATDGHPPRLSSHAGDRCAQVVPVHHGYDASSACLRLSWVEIFFAS